MLLAISQSVCSHLCQTMGQGEAPQFLLIHSNAPISPGSVRVSASSRMRNLYWALNRLRLAVGTTSGSGIPVWAISFRDMFTLLYSTLYPKFLSRVVSLILAHRGVVLPR
jgi:hypothetical protein